MARHKSRGRSFPYIFFTILFSLFCAKAQQEEPVYQIANDLGPAVTKFGFGDEAGEDNKTYMAFDSRGYLYYYDFRDKASYGFLVKEKGDTVQKIDLMPAIRTVCPKSVTPVDTLCLAYGNIEIDNNDRIYLVYYVYDPQGLARSKWEHRLAVLLYSFDHGAHFFALRIPGDPDQVILERRNHATTSDWPPLIGWATSTDEYVSKMAERNIFGVFMPQIKGSALLLGAPIVITTESPGISVHTGGISFACTYSGTSYVAYNEIPASLYGNNIWVAKLSRGGANIVDRTLVTNLPKPVYQDVHITPLMSVSADGTLYLITDADGYAFGHYTADGNLMQPKWKLVASLPGARIYSDFLIDGAGQLQLVYTEWSRAPKTCYQWYDPKTKKWSPPTTLLVVPPGFVDSTNDNYGIYYYKTCLDEEDNYYVSFSFWDSYDPTHLFPRRVLMKEAGKDVWKVLPP